MKQDLEDLLTQEYIDNMAAGHLEAWKDRYCKHGGNHRRVRADLYYNHDSSCEIESVEADLKRPLSDKESQTVISRFNRAVFNRWKQGNL